MSFRDEKIIRPVWPFALNHNSPQAQGLVAWYPMAHPGGNKLFDFIGGRDLPPGGGGWPLTDFGVGWDTASTYTASISSTPLTAVPLTIACWAMPFGTGNRVWGMVGRTGTTWDGWYIEIEGGVWKAATAAGSLSYVKAADAASVVARTLYHIAAVYESDSSRKLYVNGRLVATNTSSATPSNVNGIRIGAGFIGGANFDGITSEARIYNRALSPAEVFALYDPQTRYDLYWELGRRAWSIPPSADQTIEPNAISQTVSVPNPTVAPGQVTIAPSLLTQSVSVPHPTVAPGAVTVAPDVISQGVAMQQPTIAPGAVTVAPSLLTQAISIPNPTVGQAGGGAALALSDAAVTLVTVSDTLLTV